MKPSRFRLALLAILCGASLAHADILILKNGSRVEGSILQEAPDGSVRMRYRLTPKIWDEKTFLANDIQQVIKQTPEEVEIIELRKLMPTPDLMPADKYEQLIQDRLRPFVNKYKGTKEAKEIEDMIAAFQEEKSKVSNGEVKFEGKWLSAQEAKAEQFTIQAHLALSAIRAKNAEGKWSQALREYDNFTKQGPALRATRHYPAIITEVLTALDKWAVQLNRMASEQPVLKKEREDGLKKLEEPDLSRTKAAIANETSTWRAEAQAARNNKQRWIEPNKYDNFTIEATQKEVISEKTKLQLLDLEATRVQNEALSTVLRKIGEKDYAGGVHAFNQVAHLKTSPLYKDIIQDLESRLRAIYNELLTRQRSGAGSMTTQANPSVTGSSTSQDARVASILAETTGGGAPAPASAGGQQDIAGLTLNAPLPLVKQANPATPVDGLIQAMESYGANTDTLQLLLTSAEYKPTITPNIDDAIAGSVASVSKLPGVTAPRHTATDVAMPGATAKRLAFTSMRGNQQLDVGALYLVKGQHMWIVQATYLGADQQARATAESVLASVRFAGTAPAATTTTTNTSTAAPRPVSAPVTSAPAAPVAVAAPAEESSTQLYVMIGAGALVLLVLIAFMMGQKKREREA